MLHNLHPLKERSRFCGVATHYCVSFSGVVAPMPNQAFKQDLTSSVGGLSSVQTLIA